MSIEFWHFRAMSPCTNPYFIGTFGHFSIPMSTWLLKTGFNITLENRSEFGQKRLKKPEKAPKSPIFARRCRAK